MSAACPVFGIIVRVVLAPEVELESLLRALREGVLEPRGLVATVLEPRGQEIVITGDGFQATDMDREAIVTWFNAQPLIARYDVSQLGDVGHAA
jgi:hypothetical protein